MQCCPGIIGSNNLTFPCYTASATYICQLTTRFTDSPACVVMTRSATGDSHQDSISVDRSFFVVLFLVEFWLKDMCQCSGQAFEHHQIFSNSKSDWCAHRDTSGPRCFYASGNFFRSLDLAEACFSMTGVLIESLLFLSATVLWTSGNFFSTQGHAAAGFEEAGLTRFLSFALLNIENREVVIVSNTWSLDFFLNLFRWS